MRQRPTHGTRLAVTLTVGALLVATAGVILAVSGAGWGSVYLDEPVAGVVLALVGGVLAKQVPHNRIGWLFLAGGCGGAVATLANAYVAVADAAGTRGAGVIAASAAGGSLWLAPFLVIPILLLLFPSGHPRSSRWRLATGAGVVGGALILIIMAIGGGIGSATGAEPPASLFMLALGAAVLVVISLLAGLVHLGMRARAARGDERQQMRWLLAGGVATLLLIVVGFTTLDANEGALTLNEVVFASALLPLPLATGVAVLRYRLYDLGRLVSRTVVYGVLTAALLGVYLILVTFAALITPASRTSPLAVAGSTLAAATLFRPLRARLQALVDRHFNRRRYDADRVAGHFRAHVRDQVDLQTVTVGLVNAAQHTVQPRAVDLWLRPPGPWQRAPSP